MKIDNAIFRDLESFGKREVFKMAIEKFWILVGAILKYPEMDKT